MERETKIAGKWYTVCQDCHQEMNPGSGCSMSIVQIDGTDYYRIKAGDKADLFPNMTIGHICNDCNVKIGQYHHYGCGLERCPKCYDLLSICGCNDKYFIKTKTDINSK